MSFAQGQQAWVVRCQYPEKQPFIFGSVWVDAKAGHFELDTAANAAMDEILPTRPKIIGFLPGQIVFHPAEAA